MYTFLLNNAILSFFLRNNNKFYFIFLLKTSYLSLGAIFLQIQKIEVLLDKKKIMIRNFGSLVLRKKKERMGRNPKTKEEYKISKRYAITFYPAKNLKQSINEDI